MRPSELTKGPTLPGPPPKPPQLSQYYRTSRIKGNRSGWSASLRTLAEHVVASRQHALDKDGMALVAFEREGFAQLRIKHFFQAVRKQLP